MASNFTRPTLSDLIDRAQTDIENALVGVNARVRRTVEYVLARAMAGLSHSLHGHLAWVAEQILPDQAAEPYLLRWADLFGVPRKEGVKASGPLSVMGTGGTMPVGTKWIRPADGAVYLTTSGPHTISSTTIVALQAELTGDIYNEPSGTLFTIETPISGITSPALTDTGGITGGVTLEALDDLLIRLLARIQKAPLGGAPGDHVTWALEVAGVTRAWEYPGVDGNNDPGPGKVSLTFVRDGDVTLIPDAGEVAAVQAYLDDRSPADVDSVFAPTEVPTPMTIQLAPNTVPVQDAVKAELEDLYLREAEPGGTLLLSLINEAISNAIGETDHILVVPASNVTHAFGEMPTLGTITWAGDPVTHIYSHEVTGWSTIDDAVNIGGWVADQFIGYSPTQGRHGAGAFLLADAQGSVRRTFDEADAEVFVHFAVYFDELGYTTKICELYNNSGADLCLALHVQADGTLLLLDANGAEVGRSRIDTIHWRTWHSIAIGAEIGSDTGRLRLWVDDKSLPTIEVLSADLSDGSTDGCDAVEWQITGGGTRAFRLCQVLIYDSDVGSAGDQLVDYVGNVRMYSLLPDGDNSVTWDRSTGSVNHDLVDDPLDEASDADGTYVTATTGGKLDLYTFEDLPADAVDPIAVVIVVEVRNDGAYPGAAFGTQLKSADDAETTAGEPTIDGAQTSYVELQNFYRRPLPIAEGDWDVGEVNGMKAGPYAVPG